MMIWLFEFEVFDWRNRFLITTSLLKLNWIFQIVTDEKGIRNQIIDFFLICNVMIISVWLLLMMSMNNGIDDHFDDEWWWGWWWWWLWWYSRLNRKINAKRKKNRWLWFLVHSFLFLFLAKISWKIIIERRGKKKCEDDRTHS